MDRSLKGISLGVFHQRIVKNKGDFKKTRIVMHQGVQSIHIKRAIPIFHAIFKSTSALHINYYHAPLIGSRPPLEDFAQQPLLLPYQNTEYGLYYFHVRGLAIAAQTVQILKDGKMVINDMVYFDHWYNIHNNPYYQQRNIVRDFGFFLLIKILPDNYGIGAPDMRKRIFHVIAALAFFDSIKNPWAGPDESNDATKLLELAFGE